MFWGLSLCGERARSAAPQGSVTLLAGSDLANLLPVLQSSLGPGTVPFVAGDQATWWNDLQASLHTAANGQDVILTVPNDLATVADRYFTQALYGSNIPVIKVTDPKTHSQTLSRLQKAKSKAARYPGPVLSGTSMGVTGAPPTDGPKGPTCNMGKAVDSGQNWYRRDESLVSGGGMCTCPDGKVFEVGGEGTSCKSLACEGGSAGLCDIHWPGNGMRVTCARPVTNNNKEGPHNCAEEGGTCYCKGTVVYSDELGNSASKTVDGQANCTNDDFGDPMLHERKHCTCLPAAKEVCAKEGEDCICHGTVRYGTGSRFTDLAVDGTVACTKDSFDGIDPSGETNSCYCIPEWKPCANEGEVCECKGQVMYGGGAKWVAPKTVSGKVNCDNSTFGDPNWLGRKACYCQTAAETTPPPM